MTHKVDINSDVSLLRIYMEEIGWLNRSAYAVWLHGCTDGWPRAIFMDEEAAENWIKTISLNPEGYSITPFKFTELAKEIVGEDY